ncbi:MAG: PAS domain S-box protein [Cyanobacteria bacterium P01_C01_bin.120]
MLESSRLSESASRPEIEAALTAQTAVADRLNLALNAAQMGTWDWDLIHDTHYWSAQTKVILGYAVDADVASYQYWLVRVHPDDRLRVEAAIVTAKNNQTIFAEEYRVCWPDQSQHWVLAQGQFLYMNGQPLRMIGVIQEISQSKQAALNLAASEARFRAVFEQAAVGMARLSPTGHWQQVNATFCQLLGYQAEELVGKPFQQFTDPTDLEQDHYYYQQLISHRINSCRFEKRYLHQDGTPIWTLVTVSTETDDQNQIVAFIAVIEDIRQLKQTTAELQQRARELEQMNSLLAVTNALLDNRNSELDQFAYVTSHDLKAPLRAIANLSEWLEEDLGKNLPAENRHQLTLLRNRVHRMEALINGLLEYSRVGRRERRVESVDVRALLMETIDLLSPPAAFEILLPEKMPHLQTNRAALNQVFANLISNAIKHHDREDGQIQIAASEQNQYIEFVVSDDGPGIEPQYHQKVFTIFQTLKPRDELESTGIGLAIVKKIVDSEGGIITLESTSGQGTTFRFTWPR